MFDNNILYVPGVKSVYKQQIKYTFYLYTAFMLSIYRLAHMY